jgi:hypothetical protein
MEHDMTKLTTLDLLFLDFSMIYYAIDKLSLDLINFWNT